MDADLRAPADLAFAITTFNRPHAAARLVRSIRAEFGGVPIYLADQSRPDPAIAAFADRQGVEFLQLPFDCGVSAARNTLVEIVRERYFVLCDDDFIMRPDTDFSGAVAILEGFPEIAVVGGRLWDHHDGVPHHRSWELMMQLDRRARMLLNVPIQSLMPQLGHLGGRRFFYCDAVMNFAVMRRSVFERGIAWDPRFKCNGEHEDFYLNLKEKSPFRVCYLPEVVADHDHVAGLDYSALRHRTDGWQMFFDKWDIDQIWESGMGVRSRAAPGDWMGQEAADRRFLHTVSGVPLPEENAAGAVLISDEDQLLPATPYTGVGDRAVADQPASAELVILGQGSLIAVPDEPHASSASRQPTPLAAKDFVAELKISSPIAPGAMGVVWVRLASKGDAKLPQSYQLPVAARWRCRSRYLSWEAAMDIHRQCGPEGAESWFAVPVKRPAALPDASVLEIWLGMEAPKVLIIDPIDLEELNMKPESSVAEASVRAVLANVREGENPPYRRSTSAAA